MKQRPKTKKLTIVTVISRNDCASCQELIQELKTMKNGLAAQFEVIDMDRESPPSFAQGIIIPATYIGERLWRYGKYSKQALAERLQREVDNADQG
ncbi:MAG: hypothetical protein JSU61_08810 [Fidelibacterota bacterium]|nr:MAG: hypothetical protein JSU61_08810 [Candidatus Neomarinimicrobiota bacterium]